MRVRGTIWGCAGAVALAVATSAVAQDDPFGALYGQPAQGQKPQGARQDRSSNGSGAMATTGSQSVGAAVGRSYAGSSEKGQMSLAQIAILPKALAPLPVRLDGSGTRYLKGRPRIAVPAYAFALQRDNQTTASAAGAGSDIAPRRTTLTTHLDGISDELGAQLAQEAYDDLVARLRAAGFDVVAAEEVQAAPHMRAMGRYPGAVIARDGVSIYAPPAAPAIKGYAYETGMAAIAASGSLLNLGQASKELDAVLLTPQLLVNHIGLESTGQRNYVGSAQVGGHLRFALTNASRSQFVWGNERGGAMPGVFTMKGSGSDEPFAILVQTEDRSDDAGVASAFAQAGIEPVYRQSLVYAVRADPGRFAALCRAAFQGFNTALVDEIQRARAS